MGNVKFPDAQPPYGFDGDPDIYGLGIRIGYYTQILSVWIANYWVPKEAHFLHSINVMFLAAMLLAVGFLASRIPNIYGVEVFILLNISYSMSIFGTDSNFPRRVLPWETRTAHMIVKHLVVFGLDGYNLWYWYYGLAKMKPTNTKWGTNVYWYAQGELYGWVRNANQVMSICYTISTLYLLTEAVVGGYTNYKLDRCCTDEAFEALEERMVARLANHGDPEQLPVLRKKSPPSIRSYFNMAVVPDCPSGALTVSAFANSRPRLRALGKQPTFRSGLHSTSARFWNRTMWKRKTSSGASLGLSDRQTVDVTKPELSFSPPEYERKPKPQARDSQSFISTSPIGLSTQTTVVYTPPPHPRGIPEIDELLEADIYLSGLLASDRKPPRRMFRVVLDPVYLFRVLILAALRPFHLPGFVHLWFYLCHTDPATPFFQRQQNLLHYLLSPLPQLPTHSALHFMTRLRMVAHPPPAPLRSEWMWDAFSTIGVCITLTIGTELTLQWNEIKGVQFIESPGQLVPFALGVGGLFKVLYAALTHGKGPGGIPGNEDGCDWTCASTGRKRRWLQCAEVYYQLRAVTENAKLEEELAEEKLRETPDV